MFGAAGATVVAPAAIVLAALAVGFAGGGIQGLGALGQTLTGPELPLAAVAGRAEIEQRQGDRGSRLLAAAEQAREERAARARRPGAPAAAPTAPRKRSGGGTDRRQRRPSSGGGKRPPAGQPQPPPQTTPPPPEPEPSVIRQTGDQVKRVVEPVPVVGETGAAVVEQLVTTADEVCPPPVCPAP